MQVSSTRKQNGERSSLLVVSQDQIDQEFLMFKGTWTVTIDCESKYMLMVSLITQYVRVSLKTFLMIISKLLMFFIFLYLSCFFFP